MVKKILLKRNTKRAAKKISFKNLRSTTSNKYIKKNNLKLKNSISNINSSNLKSKQKEEINIDLISQIFFDVQSSIKVQCCFCNKNIKDSIKILLEPFPKNINISQKKYSFPLELICLKCLIVKLKNNYKEIKSLNYFNDSIPHQYTHYRIINKMEEPIFTDDWSFGDEIKLLGGLERLGIGNWEEISKITGKGKFECESHYFTFYYKKKGDFIPKININSNINLNNNNYKNEMKKNKEKEKKILLERGTDLGYIPFSIDNNVINRSININRKNSKSEHTNSIIMQNACNTLGYCPKRNEFDVEYKNDAEIELMEIEYKENDSQNVNDMYDKILYNYNTIIDKREERKNFVLNKDLFDVKKQIMKEKKLSREDRDIYQSIKQNIKFLTNEEFQGYLEGIILEKNLKSRLNQLLYYYKLGYKTYDQIFKYINELKQKTNKIKSKYNPKSNIEQLSISLRESTVKQVNKLIGNDENEKTKNKDIEIKLNNK
jgi:transcriptional adapter 2-alpha